MVRAVRLSTGSAAKFTENNYHSDRKRTELWSGVVRPGLARANIYWAGPNDRNHLWSVPTEVRRNGNSRPEACRTSGR